MNIKILPVSHDDYFIIDATNKPKVVGRTNNIIQAIEELSDIIKGVSIEVVEYPTDYLYNILMEKDCSHTNYTAHSIPVNFDKSYISHLVHNHKAVYICDDCGKQIVPDIKDLGNIEINYELLLNVAIKTLKDNLHLTDGDNCTLKELRDIVIQINPKWDE